MPRTEKQFEQIREEKRDLIKSVALELFAKEGYYNTSISKIARGAKISKGLIYNYFESKEDLIKEIVFDGIDTFIEVFDPNKDGILTDDELEFFIGETFRILKSNTNYWRLYFSLLMQSNVYKLVGRRFLKLIIPLMKTLKNYLEWKGSKNPLVDVRLFAALMDGICLHYVLDPKDFPLDDIKERIFKLFTINN
ncbi:MAG: TetR/AcrR family transcriptional regulator [Bacteroidales bacterium]|nr:TetR/AcrR family transcriptional regulator [Bacteroidales bacterium]